MIGVGSGVLAGPMAGPGWLLANVVTIAFVAFLGTIVFLVAWLVTPVLQQIAAALGSNPLQWPQLPALDEIAPRTLSFFERHPALNIARQGLALLFLVAAVGLVFWWAVRRFGRLARRDRRRDRRLHRIGGRPHHRMPVRARPRHADRPAGGHRPRRAAGDSHPGTGGAGADASPHDHRSRQDGHRDRGPDPPRRERPPGRGPQACGGRRGRERAPCRPRRRRGRAGGVRRASAGRRLPQRRGPRRDRPRRPRPAGYPHGSSGTLS